MNKILFEAGRLISTSDMRLAKKLQQVVRVADITRGATPEDVRPSGANISFMLGGEFYELAPVVA